MARTELPNGVILPAEYSDDWYEDMTSNLTKLDDVIGSDSEKLNADGVDFLRMSSAALTDGGTGNFSDLNSSYKIKTGDLILDSGRKLYQVVSVDATNETFTVGNSLFKVTAESDLAPVAESGDYDDLDNKPDLNPYDQHIANTDIHVTAADKNRWNNQTYVFRYSSTALTPSSTNSNSLLDNTDNLKVGDKVIDSSGVLFSITAIDTANSTFTIGSALIDLAKDSDVVHTSENETVGGQKTFTNTIKSKKEIEFTGNRLAYILPEFSASYSGLSLCTYDSNGAVKIGSWKVDDNDNTKHVLDTSLGYLSVSTGSVNSVNLVYLTPKNTTNSKLGDSTNKWKEINGLTPSSLSLPSNTGYVDISGYFTNTGTGEFNSYPVTANGWIFLRLGTISSCQVSVLDSNSNLLYGTSISGGIEQILVPVIAGTTFQTQWATASTVTVANAKFIPCHGNI